MELIFYIFRQKMEANNGIRLLCVSYEMFRTHLTAFLHATSNLLILLSYNDHKSHPYLLLQYAWNNLVLAEQLNLLKKHIMLFTWPMKQLRLKRTSSLSLKLDVIMCPRCENDSTRSMGLPPIEKEQRVVWEFVCLRQLCDQTKVDFWTLNFIPYSVAKASQKSTKVYA